MANAWDMLSIFFFHRFLCQLPKEERKNAVLRTKNTLTENVKGSKSVKRWQEIFEQFMNLCVCYTWCLWADELFWHSPCCVCCKIRLLSVYWLTIKKQRPRKLHEYHYRKKITQYLRAFEINRCECVDESRTSRTNRTSFHDLWVRVSFLRFFLLLFFMPFSLRLIRAIKEYILFRSNNETLNSNSTQKTYNSFEWTTNTRNKTIWTEFIDLFEAEFVITGLSTWK